MPEATADTRVLTQWAIRILRRIYRPGFGYHKAGVMLLDLVPAAKRQLALFDSQGGAGDARSGKLMAVLDDINQRYGRQSLRLAAEGSSALGRCGGVTCRRAIRRVGTDCRWRVLAVMDS